MSLIHLSQEQLLPQPVRQRRVLSASHAPGDTGLVTASDIQRTILADVGILGTRRATANLEFRGGTTCWSRKLLQQIPT